MPIYEYRCEACAHEVEALQKVGDSPLRKCPECGKLALRRLMSAPVFRLKGGGWYETDFKGGGDEKKRNLVETSGAESKETAASADSGKSEAPAKSADDASAKDAKKPADKSADKPAASEVKKPARKARAGKPSRT